MGSNHDVICIQLRRQRVFEPLSSMPSKKAGWTYYSGHAYEGRQWRLSQVLHVIWVFQYSLLTAALYRWTAHL